MARRKLTVICQSGGKFTTNADGTLSYSGGDAHAMSVNGDTKFVEFNSDISEMWKYDHSSLTIKYFLPNNQRTLITISSDKDVQRMLEFHEDSATVDVFVIPGDLTSIPCCGDKDLRGMLEFHEDSATVDISVIPGDLTSIPCCGSSQTTTTEPLLSEPISPDAMIDCDGDADVQDDDDQQILSAEAEDARLQMFNSEAGDVGKQKLPASWKDKITGVGQHFDSKNDFHEALFKYSVARGFTYTTVTSDAKRLRMRCKADGCPWRITVTKLSTTSLFRIRRINERHTCCAVDWDKIKLPIAPKKFLADIVKEKVRNTPDSRPGEIINDIRRDYGIELKYGQAWRGIEIAREELLGSYKEAYNQLPWVCEKIIETNPGSVSTLVTKDDLSFHRIFIAFHASLHGFQKGCRPLLFLDNMSIKSKYPGELLTATALDANDGVFPVAFGIVDVLSDDNWLWFLVQLEVVLSKSENITFVADKKRVFESLPLIFKNCYRSYCLNHLLENLKDEMKGPFNSEVSRMIVSEIHAAAYAPTTEGFRKCMETIKKISSEVYEWVPQSNPEHWANAYFGGSRFNHVRCNIGESFYIWVSNLPSLQVIQVIETLYRKMMHLIYTRREDSEQWSSRLAPSSEEKLQKITLSSRSLGVMYSSTSQSLFEVRDPLSVINIVNLDNWDCTCREWQITSLPCLHAVAVIERIGKNVYDYCSKYLTTEAFRVTYSESIKPVPITEGPSSTLQVLVHPPCTPRQKGRPKERNVVSKRPQRCSKCGNVGHRQTSCQAS